MRALELLKEFEDIINSSGENGEYGKAIFHFNLAIHSRFLVAIKELEDLIQENKSLVKTLEKYNEEMIELRKQNQDLLNIIIDVQEAIRELNIFTKE